MINYTTPIRELEEVRHETAPKLPAGNRGYKALAGSLWAAVLGAALATGCAARSPSDIYVDFMERDQSYFVEKGDKPTDLQIVEAHGINRIEFYTNKDDKKPVHVATSLSDLESVCSGWGGEGVVNGKVIHMSQELPIETDFKKYLLTIINCSPEGIKKVVIHTKTGEKREFER